MKNKVTILLVFTLFGCTSYPLEKELPNTAQLCLGNSNLPADLENKFELFEDKQLLNEALGSPNEGKLCQGKVYKSKEDRHVTIYRAWNSTNSNSKF